MLHIHRSERADGLVEALGDIVQEPLADPFATEVVAVPTRGVERWLAQRLSARLGASPARGDGVCANVDFPFPGRLLGSAVATASGIDADGDPWLPERAVWPLLDVVDEGLGGEAAPWLAPLAAHLGRRATTEPRSRRFETVRHLADLYDGYGVHRPAMLRCWSIGDDTDGVGAALPETARWQAEVWRRLRRRIGAASPAERLPAACERLRADPAVVALPERVSLFGLTRLPASHLEVLRALAAGREVHLFLLHPSPALWDKVQAALGPKPSIARRADDPTATLPDNPLLASWGHDARELQIVLAGADEASRVDHRPVEGAPATLLQRVQADVRADRSPPGAPFPGRPDLRPRLDPDDRSLQVHACHGLARQVEVVRDAILHLLADDPTLEARDIVVMCPDIESFAPLIHATFGAGTDGNDHDGGGGGGGDDAVARTADLRVRLADRSLRQTNPVLGVVSDLLDLASARVTAAQVLDLAGREPVRRRFELDDDDLARLEDWVAATGVRWGLDAEHRAPFHLQWLGANTWRAGLDRVLLGVALAEHGEPLLDKVLPLDDVGSGDIDLAGRLAELVDRLQDTLDELNEPKTVRAWTDAIATAADALTATLERDVWQRLQLDRVLDDIVAEATDDIVAEATDDIVAEATNDIVAEATNDIVAEATNQHSAAEGTNGGGGHGARLTLPEVRALLADRLAGRPTKANFRTGHLTICTLVPMRSVPHRVVCLLGLDDGVFPRKTAHDGDDLILRDPHVGDRDGRAEDRQLLLDALLAATDRLVITYCGRDERTNARRPPAVPVGELLDVVDRTVATGETGPDGEPVAARRRVVVHHPLQPFDVRNFVPGALVADTPWSFDEVALEGARALSSAPAAAPPFLSGPLPATPADVVELDQLVRFVQHPVKAFLRQRLGMSLSDRYEELSAAVPIDLDYLEQWELGQRLVEARLAGADPARCIEAEMARGLLPPGALSSAVLGKVSRMVEEVVAATLAVAPAVESGSAEVNLSLLGRRALVGTVPGVSGAGGAGGVAGGVAGRVVRSVSYSRLGAKHRLAAWVRFLTLTAAYPDRSVEAVTIGRRRADGPAKHRVTVSRLGPIDAEIALGHLGALVDLYDRGMREPLPLYCGASAAWAEAVASGRHPEVTAARAWESDYDYDREDKELEHQLVLGGRRTFAEILAAAPRPDDAGDGWPPEQASRFGLYSLRLWNGLLSYEELDDR